VAFLRSLCAAPRRQLKRSTFGAPRQSGIGGAQEMPEPDRNSGFPILSGELSLRSRFTRTCSAIRC